MRTLLLRSFIVLAAWVGGHSVVLAQPNPDCNPCTCNFPSWNGQGFSSAGTYTFTDCPYTQNVTLNSPGTQFGRFYAYAGQRYTISLCGETANTFIYITTNTTIPGVIVCDNDGCGTPNGPSSTSFIPPANALYRVYVMNGGCVTYPATPATPLDITIACSVPPALVNNVPCGAQQNPGQFHLPSNSPDCNFTAGTNVGATNAAASVPGIGGPPLCNGALYQGADVWYTTTVPADGLLGVMLEPSSMCAGAIQLYTANACDGTFTQVAGTCTSVGLTGPASPPHVVLDAFALNPPLAPNTLIYIRVWERNANENGSFNICAYDAKRPPNDSPCAPIALPLNTSCVPLAQVFENTSLSSEISPIPAPGCGNQTNLSDVWFTFQVPNPFPPNYTGITVNTTSSNANLNLGMAWYRLTGPCPGGSMQLVGCNNNISAGNPMPTINSANGITLVEGETIYVRLWNEGQWIGPYQICAYLNQAPVNDNPCGALPLPVNYGCIMTNTSNENATITPTNPPGVINAPNPTCAPPANADVWYTAVVPPNGVLQFDTQAGSLQDAAMAVYRVLSGSCASNNLSLQQVGCWANGSQQGPASSNMPYGQVTGLVPGTTVYIRVWQQGGNTGGTFGICARRTDPPPGDCYYTLTLNDSGGDGWNGSYVTVCVGGVCADYTVNGSQASINIGANVGQTLSVSYTAAGGFQNQNSYILTQYNIPVYQSGTPPPTGTVVATTVSCDPPPAPPSDCMGAIPMCNGNTFVNQNWQGSGGVNDLNSSNQGCVSQGENMGMWLTFNIDPLSAPCSPLAFHIVPQGSSFTIFDFAVWGPFPSVTPLTNICPPPIPGMLGQPTRCSWASFFGTKGLNYNNSLPTSEGGGGTGFVRHLTVNPGEKYIIYVDNWAVTNATQFQIVWIPVPNGFVNTGPCTQPGTTPPPANSGGPPLVSCEVLPIDLLAFDARASGPVVEVDWEVAREVDVSHYIVERSADGEHFEEAGRVAAVGHTLQSIRYQFVDQQPLSGLSYYRLHQVINDGNMSTTHMVPVLFGGGRTELEVFPNPANETLWLSFVSSGEDVLMWRIHDASGRRVTEASFNATAGKNLIELPIARLDQGSYTVEVISRDGGSIGISRFVKQ